MADSQERAFEIMIVFGVIVLAAAFVYLYSRPVEVPEEKIYQCLQDSGCTLVKADCCGCNAGGKRTAINKLYLDYWEQRLDMSCRDTVCTAVISNDISCSAEARCIKGKCAVMGFV